MLTSWDEYPIHQTSLPIAVTASSEGGRYDRYWLAMYDLKTTTQLGVALGIYPNRMVVDASVSISRDGKQSSVFASGPLMPDRITEVGPIKLQVIEPMRVIRVSLQNVGGMSCDLEFSATSPVFNEGHMRRVAGNVLLSERTRFVQFGEWSGEFTYEGEKVTCKPGEWLGVRDRSWGSRTTGTVSELSMDSRAKSIWFSWALVPFKDNFIVAGANEGADGWREASAAGELPRLSPGRSTYDESLGIRMSNNIDFDITYVAGTRRPCRAGLTIGPRGAIDHHVDLELHNVFLLKGLGYFHPLWAHGSNKGGLQVGTDSWKIEDLDPTATENLATDHIATAGREDGQVGIGWFEHIAIGSHDPSGFTDDNGPAHL